MHDDDYDEGGDKSDRKEADRMLFFRMMKKSFEDKNKHPSVILWMVFIAYLYYIAVRLFGHFYFNYKTTR